MAKDNEPVCSGKQAGWHDPTKIYKKVFEIWAGTKSDCRPFLGSFDLLLNCSGMSTLLPKHKIPMEWGKKFETVEFKEIYLDWDNMAAVMIDSGFWKELINHLRENALRLLVFCQGGHGRTGTAVAALLISDGWTADEAIFHVRSTYCPKAIESMAQWNYLHDLEKYYKVE